MELKTIFKSPETKAIIIKLNHSIRAHEGMICYQQIRYLLAGWAELFAMDMFGLDLVDINPELSELLYRLREYKGELACGEDLFTLIDYGIAALDLRAPEDKEEWES